MDEDIDAFIRRVVVEPPPNASALLQRQGSLGLPQQIPMPPPVSNARYIAPEPTLIPVQPKIPRPSTPPLPAGGMRPGSSELASQMSNMRIHNSFDNLQSPGSTYTVPTDQVSTEDTLITGNMSENSRSSELNPTRHVILLLESNDPYFPTISREICKTLKVGRHMPDTETDAYSIEYDTKVVSRSHAEIWVERGVEVYIRDLGSKSGTFLNGQRLSPPGNESPPARLNNNDVLQFGVDYKDRNIKEQRAVVVTAILSSGPPIAPAIATPSGPVAAVISNAARKGSPIPSEYSSTGGGSYPGRDMSAPRPAIGIPIKQPQEQPGPFRLQSSLSNLTQITGAVKR